MITGEVQISVRGESTDLASSPLTEDFFLGGRLSLLQPKKGFRAGIDSVFLAASVPCVPGDHVFEAGMGPGVAALCLASRVGDLSITGVERSKLYALLAQKNADRNGFSQSIQVISGDVRHARHRDLTIWPPHGTFDHAFANPPFFQEGEVLMSSHILTSEAKVFSKNDLLVWVNVLFLMLKHRGTATFILRTEALQEVLSAMTGKFGGIKILPIQSSEKSAAHRMIIFGVKNSKTPLTLLPPFIVHQKNKQFTAKAEAILRHGERLILDGTP